MSEVSETVPYTAPTELVLVTTGERLPATPENAATVLAAAREMKARIDGIIRTTEAWLAAESRRQGTKTFHTEAGTVTLSGGPTVDYRPAELKIQLFAAGMPKDRIDEIVVTEISYKVDRVKLRQATGANPAYKEAAERASVTTEKPLRASVKS